MSVEEFNTTYNSSTQQRLCLICNRDFYYTKFGGHLLEAHSITSEDYYIKFALNGIVPDLKCNHVHCSNLITFDRLSKGFHQFCGESCQTKHLHLTNHEFSESFFRGTKEFRNAPENSKMYTLVGGRNSRYRNRLNIDLTSMYTMYIIQLTDKVIKVGCGNECRILSLLGATGKLLYKFTNIASKLLDLEDLVLDATEDYLYFEDDRHELVDGLGGVSELRYAECLPTLLQIINKELS